MASIGLGSIALIPTHSARLGSLLATSTHQETSPPTRYLYRSDAQSRARSATQCNRTHGLRFSELRHNTIGSESYTTAFGPVSDQTKMLLSTIDRQYGIDRPKRPDLHSSQIIKSSLMDRRITFAEEFCEIIGSNALVSKMIRD